MAMDTSIKAKWIAVDDGYLVTITKIERDGVMTYTKTCTTRDDAQMYASYMMREARRGDIYTTANGNGFTASYRKFTDSEKWQ